MRTSHTIWSTLLPAAIMISNSDPTLAADGVDGAKFKTELTKFLGEMGSIEDAAAKVEGDNYAVKEIVLHLGVSADEGIIIVSAQEEATVTLVLGRKE